jgi:outer membrane scaffolding protein for murein synthesis (MipA/OmpV family)
MKTALPLPAFRTFPAAILSVTFAFGLIVPPLAFAEISNESLLGPGLRSQPAYDGSASQSVEFVPVIRYFGEYWFARSTQGVLEGGGRLELAPGLHAGAQLAYEPGRKMSKSDFLENHNLSDVDAGASVGVQLEWDHKFGPMPITLLGRARQNIDSDLGAQADLRLSAGVFHSGRFSAGVFTQTTFANAKSAGSFYDITPQQSATTGLPEFQAGSGLLFASVGLLWSVDVSQDWIVVGSMESRHLQGDAEHSPLAERGSNYYASVGLAYRF